MRGRGQRRSAALAVAACAALVLVLGACDSHSKPTAVPPLSTSPAPSATTAHASPSASIGPASPTSESIVGPSAMNSAFPSAAARIPDAIETVRRFFDGLNHESDTGDETAVIGTFTTKCNLCGSGVYSIKSLLDGEHKLRGGHIHLLAVNSAVATYGNVVSVDVTESQDSAQQVDETGHVVQTFPSSSARRVIFELETDDSPPKIWQLTRADE